MLCDEIPLGRDRLISPDNGKHISEQISASRKPLNRKSSVLSICFIVNGRITLSE